MSIKHIISPIVLSLLLVPTLAVADGHPPKETTCRACHGDKGAAPIAPVYPKLQGQNKAYLVAALKAYRAGQRQGGLSAVMTAQAKGLSDAEIDALADYYAKQ